MRAGHFDDRFGSQIYHKWHQSSSRFLRSSILHDFPQRKSANHLFFLISQNNLFWRKNYFYNSLFNLNFERIYSVVFFTINQYEIQSDSIAANKSLDYFIRSICIWNTAHLLNGLWMVRLIFYHYLYKWVPTTAAATATAPALLSIPPYAIFTWTVLWMCVSVAIVQFNKLAIFDSTVKSTTNWDIDILQ